MATLIAAIEQESAVQRKGWLSTALRTLKVRVGLAILLVFLIAAIVGPYLVQNPTATSAATLQGPSWHHWLGTTQIGQDVFAQLVVSARVSLLVGAVAAALAITASVLIGITGPFLGGVWDEGLSMLTNVFLVMPALPLAIVISSYFKGAGTLLIALVISITSWAWSARVVRAQTLSLRSRDFIQAARGAGEPTWRIIIFEIFPNEAPLIAAQFLSTMIFAVLTQAGLAFLGVGNVNTWSWGTMMYWAENDGALQLGAWWWFIPPGICLALFGTSLALLNFGVDEFVHTLPVVKRRRLSDRSRPIKPTSSKDALLNVDELSVAYGDGNTAITAVDSVRLSPNEWCKSSWASTFSAPISSS